MMDARKKSGSRLRGTLIVMCLIVVVPLVAGFVFPWSEVNCWHEDVDVQTGRIRKTWYFCFVPIHTRIEKSSLSREILSEGFTESAGEWHRVNTFSPGLRYSPHYEFHGAIFQVGQLEVAWQAGNFSPEARRVSARRLLELWRTDGSYFGASKYLQIISELAFTNSERGIPTELDDLAHVNADISEIRKTSP